MTPVLGAYVHEHLGRCGFQVTWCQNGQQGLQMARDSEQYLAQLRERLGREIDAMQRLVEDSLQLAWLDTERAPLP